MEAVRLPFDWFQSREGQPFHATAAALTAELRLTLCELLPPPWPDFNADCYRLDFEADRSLSQGWYDLLAVDGQRARLMLTPGSPHTLHATIM